MKLNVEIKKVNDAFNHTFLYFPYTQLLIERDDIKDLDLKRVQQFNKELQEYIKQGINSCLLPTKNGVI